MHIKLSSVLMLFSLRFYIIKLCVTCRCSVKLIDDCANYIEILYIDFPLVQDVLHVLYIYAH